MHNDCEAFRTALYQSGNGYSTFANYGWEMGNQYPTSTIVTTSQFQTIKNYTIAYYSGHGARGTYPVINAGSNQTINVATALGVDSNNWQSSCIVKPTHPLRTVVLASCYQLDSSVAKYYARLMKASKVRAVAGYHDIAPSDGDVTIAQRFVASANVGDSVLEAWRYANNNIGWNWAVLVFNHPDGIDYEMPGFPNHAEPTIPSTTAVHRYATFLANGHQEVVTTSSQPDITTQIMSMPLTIFAVENRTRVAIPTTYNRDMAITNTSVLDNSDAVDNALVEIFGESLSNKIRVHHYVKREEVDEDVGVLSETAVIQDHSYDYFDTYNGVKIADSYIGATVDCQGVRDIRDNRKVVVSAGTTMVQLRANVSQIITKESAIAVAQEARKCGNACELYNVALAYAPTGNGEYALCYEVMMACGFCYVNVLTGEVVEFV